MVYRSGFAVSRAQARQFIRNGLFLINGKEARTASQSLRVGDVIKPISFDKIHLREGFILPEWLKANIKEKFVEINRLPVEEDFQENFNPQLIIEYYSR